MTEKLVSYIAVLMTPKKVNKWGNYHKVEFQEIKSLIFQKVKSCNNIEQFCLGGRKNDEAKS